MAAGLIKEAVAGRADALVKEAGLGRIERAGRGRTGARGAS
jgi:hypothetical protein